MKNVDKERLRKHYNSIAKKRLKWYRRNKFYHKGILKYYKFLVQKDSSILELGCATGDLIGNLSPSYGVGVDISDEMIKIAKKRFPRVNFVCSDVESFDTKKKFDYIIISGTLNSVYNIQGLLEKILNFCTPDTRIIVNIYNQLWNPILKFSQKSKLKMPEIFFNSISIDDIENFFDISGYQPVSRKFLLLFPKYIPLITFFFNKILGNLPFIRALSLQQFVIARPYLPPENVKNLTCSVVLP